MLGTIGDFISNIFNKIKELVTGLGTILSYLNPLSENFILKPVISLIGNLLSYINPFSDNFFLKDFFTWFSNFFDTLLNFFKHIFVPTDTQWQSIRDDFLDVGETAKAHIPFIGLFSEKLKIAQQTVDQNDFLVITIPSFSFSSGGIGVTTDTQTVINIRDKYEPYRAYIRGGIFLIVVGLAFVFLIKHILNASGSFSIGSIDKGGR